MLMRFYFLIISGLNSLGNFLPQLGLRVFLAWEFWSAGVMKFNGQNWFASIQDNFPYPFNVIPVEVNWQMAMWFELVGSIALLIGLGTRFFSLLLMILTVVAIISVHWPSDWPTWTALFQEGYDICKSQGGNFKLPVIYLFMFLPLLLKGPGKISMDHFIWHKYR